MGEVSEPPIKTIVRDSTPEESMRYDDARIIDDYRKPTIALLHQGKYSLAILTVLISSMSFVISLAVRSMTTGCVRWTLGLEDAATCAAGMIEGVVSFAIVMVIAILILRSYYFGLRKVYLPLRHML